MAIKEKAMGTMVGLACGDALGALIEGYNIADIKNRHGEIRDIREIEAIEGLIKDASNETEINSLQRKFKTLRMPGIYTDDTQQSLILSDCLIRNGYADIDYILNMYIRFANAKPKYEFGIFRGAGPGFIQAVTNLINFKPYNQSGVISAGNGAAMRIAPIGVFYYNNIDDLRKTVVDISLITHRDIRGIAAAALVAYTVNFLLNVKEYLDVPSFLNNLYDFLYDTEQFITLNYATVDHNNVIKHQVSDSIKLINKLLELEYEDSIRELDNISKNLSGRDDCTHTSPFALGSVLFSLYHFIVMRETPEKAIINAVNQGGDTDTIGAIVGCLCGTYKGISSIPKRWQDSLANADFIKETGQRLLGFTQESRNDDIYIIEKQLCNLESEYRSKYINLLNQKVGL